LNFYLTHINCKQFRHKGLSFSNCLQVSKQIMHLPGSQPIKKIYLLMFAI